MASKSEFLRSLEAQLKISHSYKKNECSLSPQVLQESSTAVSMPLWNAVEFNASPISALGVPNGWKDEGNNCRSFSQVEFLSSWDPLNPLLLLHWYILITSDIIGWSLYNSSKTLPLSAQRHEPLKNKINNTKCYEK